MATHPGCRLVHRHAPVAWAALAPLLVVACLLVVTVLSADPADPVPPASTGAPLSRSNTDGSDTAANLGVLADRTASIATGSSDRATTDPGPHDDDTPQVLPPLASGEILLHPSVLTLFPMGTDSLSIHEPKTSIASDDTHPHLPITAVASGQIHVLDVVGRQILTRDLLTGSITVLLRDQRQGLLHFSDFAVMRDNTVAIADNTRNAIYLFKKRRFARIIGRIGERRLFGFIRYVFTDRDGGRLGVFDSAKNRAFVFAADGKLLHEQSGSVEPCFFGDHLIHLKKTDNWVQVDVHNTVLRSSRTLFRYYPRAGRIILDGWMVGASEDRLYMIVCEGVGDEDHLDYAKLVTFHDGTTTVQPIEPSLDLQTDLARPFSVWQHDGHWQLIGSTVTESGIEIRAANLD